MKKKSVIFFSGNRAEYTFQKVAIKSLQKKFKVSFLLSGSHLKKEFGSFKKNIVKDKIKISKVLDIKGNTNNITNLNSYLSKLYSKISHYLKGKKFDYSFVFSDRFESLIFANVCFMYQIPIIHYEGGDQTSGGTYDDKIRHAISLISDFHFVSNKDSEKNLIKMGIDKKKIKDIGLLSLHENYSKRNHINKFKYFLKKNFIDKKTKFLLFTYHPIPILGNSNLKNFKTCLEALKHLSYKGWKIIVTSPNFDPFYREITKEIYKTKSNNNIIFIKNLGSFYYHSLLKFAGNNKNGICVGNSSSGIKEANFFSCPSINIGNRQLGRLKPKSVFDVKENKSNIIKKIEKVFRLNKKKKIKFEKNLYFKKNLKKNISYYLDNIDL